MPRVPLKKLKQKKVGIQGETDDPGGAADTMVGAMAKRIQQANKVRACAPEIEKVPLGGDIEHNKHETDSDESNFDNFQVGNNVVQAAAAQERLVDTERDVFNGNENIFVHGQHLNVHKEDMDTMKWFLAKLERQNKGKNLRLVLLEGDKYNNVVRDNVRINKDDEVHDKLRIIELDTSTKVEVEATVHQVEESQNIDGIQENLEEKITSHTEIKGNVNILNPAGGAKPKQITRNARQMHNLGVRRKQLLGMRPQKPDKIEKDGTAEARWGLDESSESDGGCDCDDGGIPLLHM